MKISVTMDEMSVEEFKRLVAAFPDETVDRLAEKVGAALGRMEVKLSEAGTVQVQLVDGLPPVNEDLQGCAEMIGPGVVEKDIQIPESCRRASRVREAVEWALSVLGISDADAIVRLLESLKAEIPVVAKCSDLPGRVRAIMEAAK